MAKDLGRMGELELERWAAQVELVPNKCGTDKTGWDFMVEFPIRHFNLEQRLDLRPPVLECKIQVKAHDKPTSRQSIKLDNMMRLAMGVCPAFVLSIEFGDFDPQRAYLIHIDEEYIKRILERLYDASPGEDENDDGSESEEIKLHKKTLDIVYKEEDLLTELNGRGLKEAIERHVSGHLHDYGGRKLKLIEEYGRENGKYFIGLNFETGKDVEQQLVDFSVGLSKTLHPYSVSIKEQRFGKASNVPKDVLTQVDFQFEDGPKPTYQSQVTLTIGDYTAVVPFDVFLPLWVTKNVDIAKEKLKVRLANKFVQFVFGLAPGSTNLGYKVPSLEETHLLKDLHYLGMVLSAMNKSWESGEKVLLELANPTGKPQRFHFEGTTMTPELGVLARAIESAWFIAKTFDVQDNIEVSLEDLEKDAFALAELAAILQPGGPQGISLEVFIPKEEKEVPPTLALPCVTSLQLGNYSILIAYGIAGTAVFKEEFEEENRYVLQDFRLHLEQKNISKQPISFDAEELTNKIKKAMDHDDLAFIPTSEDFFSGEESS